MNWPSTTEILRHFGLMRSYEQFGNPEALKRGRRVTAACHLVAMHRPLDRTATATGEWEGRHPEVTGYLEAYRKFMREHSFRLTECEKGYISHTHRFVSHPDQIGVLDHFGLVDLELKSGTMPKCCPLQTAGQVLAMSGHADAPTMKRFGLLLRADGTYRLDPHEDFRDFDRFRAMVSTWWTIHDYGERVHEEKS